jgi:hypothetical protein
MVSIILTVMKVERKVVPNNNQKRQKKKQRNLLPEFNEPEKMRKKLSEMMIIFISAYERLFRRKSTIY